MASDNWRRCDPGGLSPKGVVCTYQRASGRYIREYDTGEFRVTEVRSGDERAEVMTLSSLEEAKAYVDVLDNLKGRLPPR